MTIEVWATFSVRDHLVPRAFVADVLLYDRLVIPTLPRGEPEDEWPAAWNLAKQRTLLRDLGRLAIQVPWDMRLRRAWQQRLDEELAVERGAAGTDAIGIAARDAGFFRDPQYYDRGDRIVRALLQEEVPAARSGSVIEAVSAYPSFDALAAESVASEPKIDTRRLPPTVVFGWEFFFPDSEGFGEEEDRRLLQIAIELATKTDFIEMRMDFYRWWRNVAASGMPVAAVRDDMEKLIDAYQKLVQGQGWKKTAARYSNKIADAFRRSLGPIHKIFAGPAGFLGSEGLALATVPAGPNAAAIFYDARAQLGWGAPGDARSRKDHAGEKDAHQRAEEQKQRAEAARWAEEKRRQVEAARRFFKPDVDWRQLYFLAAARDVPADQVDAAVFCPPRVKTESSFLVQVYLYQPPAADEAAMQAHEADTQAVRRGTYSLPLDIPHGTHVDIHLEMEDLEIAEPDAVLIWRGRITSAQFEVVVPATKLSNTIGRVRFAVSGIPAGTLRFMVEAVAQHATAKPTWCEADAVRYHRAFASYSSEDRGEVLRRVQAFRIAGLSVFQDILELEPGERWGRALYREIDLCDVFLLFWSRAAAASEWVAKEIDYALNRKGGDDERPPAIQPVPIEGPPPVPPPAALKHLHFNDALLAHIKAGST